MKFCTFIFLGVLIVVAKAQSSSILTATSSVVGITKIVVDAGTADVGFRVSSVLENKDFVNSTVEVTACDNSSVASFTAPVFSIQGSTLNFGSLTAPSSGSCNNYTISATITYPESVLKVCVVRNAVEWCADSYYRTLPPDSPWDFVVADPGYVFDQAQGLMWTSEPIPGSFTNPNCCGFKDSVKSPDGDGPYVDAAKAACGNMTYNGLKWRLPSRSEMHRLMDHAHVKPAINTTFFTLNSSLSYWTTDRSPVQDYYWVGYGIYGSDGGITYNGDMNKQQGAFCVATVVKKVKPAEGQYLVRSANIVHDSYTGIDWTKFNSDVSYPGHNRQLSPTKYCEDMVVDGLSDWRLPTIKELVSIHPDNNNPRGPLWNHTVFDTFSRSVFWWASTPNRLLNDYYWAWVNGDGVAYINVNPGHARCVRGIAHTYDPTLQIIDSPIPSPPMPSPTPKGDATAAKLSIALGAVVILMWRS